MLDIRIRSSIKCLLLFMDVMKDKGSRNAAFAVSNYNKETRSIQLTASMSTTNPASKNG